MGITYSTTMRWQPIFGHMTKVGNHHIHCCQKCFDNKNVVVASTDAEIYSVVHGNKKTTNKEKKNK